ncbi:hypothetical protein D3C75_1013020 [compost metagenome]
MRIGCPGVRISGGIIFIHIAVESIQQVANVHFQTVCNGSRLEILRVGIVEELSLLHPVFFQFSNRLLATGFIFSRRCLDIVYEVADMGGPDRFEGIACGLPVDGSDRCTEVICILAQSGGGISEICGSVIAFLHRNYSQQGMLPEQLTQCCL